MTKTVHVSLPAASWSQGSFAVRDGNGRQSFQTRTKAFWAGASFPIGRSDQRCGPVKLPRSPSQPAYCPPARLNQHCSSLVHCLPLHGVRGMWNNKLRMWHHELKTVDSFISVSSWWQIMRFGLTVVLLWFVCSSGNWCSVDNLSLYYGRTKHPPGVCY